MKDCPVYIGFPTHSIWGGVLLQYLSLYQFFYLLEDSSGHADISQGVNPQPCKQHLYNGNGIYDRDGAATPSKRSLTPVHTINAAQPKSC
jgi:hypothetical protein